MLMALPDAFPCKASFLIGSAKLAQLSRDVHYLKAEQLRPALEIMDGPPASPHIIIILLQIDVLYLVFEHVIDDARQLVSRRGNGCGRPMARSDPSVEGA